MEVSASSSSSSLLLNPLHSEGTTSSDCSSASSSASSESCTEVSMKEALKDGLNRSEFPFDPNYYPLHKLAWDNKCVQIKERKGLGSWCKETIIDTNFYPTHIAILRGNAKALEALIERFIQTISYTVVHSPYGKLNLLGFAIVHGQVSCLDVILERDPSSLSFTTTGGGNILHLAVRSGHLAMVYHLLSKHGEQMQNQIDSPDSAGRTALSVAAELGHDQIIKYLLRQRASLECSDHQGRRALHWATKKQRLSTVRLLLSEGAELTHRTKKRGSKGGHSPSDYFRKSKSLEKRAIQELLEYAEVRQGEIPKPKLCKRPKNIVFSGGGLKCFSLLGSAKYLETSGLLSEAIRFGGTSGGAYLAALLAVGYTPRKLKRVAERTKVWKTFIAPELEPKKKKELDPLAILKILSTCTNPLAALGQALEWALSCPGLLSGDGIRTWLDGLIEKKTGNKNCTFGELGELVRTDKPGNTKFKHLHIVCTRIGAKQELIFPNSEDARWKNYIISDLVLGSGCFPFVFKPHMPHVKLGGRRYRHTQLWPVVDGGFLLNCPDKIFDYAKFMKNGLRRACKDHPRYNPYTVAFQLYNPESLKEREESDIRLFKKIKQVACIYLKAEQLLHGDNLYHDVRVVKVDNLGLKAFQVISADTLQKQITGGYQDAKDAFRLDPTPPSSSSSSSSSSGSSSSLSSSSASSSRSVSSRHSHSSRARKKSKSSRSKSRSSKKSRRKDVKEAKTLAIVSGIATGASMTGLVVAYAASAPVSISVTLVLTSVYFAASTGASAMKAHEAKKRTKHR